jgi:ABC-2 type transport system ATP-binding protein
MAIQAETPGAYTAGQAHPPQPDGRNAAPRTAIQTIGLTKYYGRQRGIEDLDLTVFDGEVFGFLGPNGSGKTTTIRLLMDLIRPTRGRATIFGRDVREHSVEINRALGYLPGELALWNNLTGRQILTYLGNLRGGVEGQQINSIASRLELDLDKKFRDLSKGNKQKVGLAQALMHRPRLLILDEPTAGLDPLNQQEFFRMLREVRDSGATVFLSSHVLSEVQHTCDRVGIIREGHLVRVGTVPELIAEKHSRITITFGVPASDEIARSFALVPGITEMSVNSHELAFSIQGDMDPVIKHAAQYPVISISSQEPTLEEAFLTYYRG